MSKSTALAPTIQPSVRGSRTGSPDLDNGYYGRSSGLVTPTEEEGAETVRREIDQIFDDYDEQAQDKLIDVDGLKNAIKKSLLTVQKNAQEMDDQQKEATDTKIAELEGFMQTTEKRFSTLVQAVMTKTEKLEQVLVRQLSYHSADAEKGRRGSRGGLKDSNLDMDEDFYSDDEDMKNGGSAERKAKKSKQLQKKRALASFRESKNYFNQNNN